MNGPTLQPLDSQRRQAVQEQVATALAQGTTLSLWAKLIPAAPAVYSVTGDRTFAGLNARSNQLVRALRARGVRAGDGVALICSNRTEFAEMFWATRRSGMRLTPINWHLTGEEAAYIANDCDAKAIVADARFRAVAEYVAANAPLAVARLAIGGPIDGYEDYESALQSEDDAELPDQRIGLQMLYTSGTTGRPKGVYRTTSPAVPNNPAVSGGYEPGAAVHLCTGPLYHAAPLTYSLALPHAFGAAVVIMDGWNTEGALQLIEKFRVTHTHLVPTMMHRLLTLPEDVRRRHDVSSLRHILHGAAPCPVPVKRALIEWLGPIVYEYYSATEGTGTFVDSHTWLTKPGTVGKPAVPEQIRIMDEAGLEQPRGSAALVYMKAPSQEQGRFQYYKDESKTSKAYRGDYYTLGDVGYLDEDGFLFLTDRSAHLIISGGVNIYPAEVEATLLTHPAVADVGVIGVPSQEWGEDVKAVVMLQPGYTASETLATELIAFCRDRLAHYKCPRSVDFVAELPRHDNGKLYKHKLREMYRSGASAR